MVQECEYSNEDNESWADFLNKFNISLFVATVHLEYGGKSPLNEDQKLCTCRTTIADCLTHRARVSKYFPHVLLLTQVVNNCVDRFAP